MISFPHLLAAAGILAALNAPAQAIDPNGLKSGEKKDTAAVTEEAGVLSRVEQLKDISRSTKSLKVSSKAPRDLLEALAEVSGKLPNLITLDLSGCEETDDKVVRDLAIEYPKLETLNLHATPVTSDIFETLILLPSLVSLDLSDTKVTDLAVLARAQKLEALNLSGCKAVKNFPALAKVKTLKSVDLSGALVSKHEYEELVRKRPDLRITFK